MKQNILELRDHYLHSKQECWELLQELYSINTDKLSAEEKEDLKTTKLTTQLEYSFRAQFVQELNDLLSV